MTKKEKILTEIEEVKEKLEHAGEGTALTMTRCCGYYRPVINMNIGLEQQVSERKMYVNVST